MRPRIGQSFRALGRFAIKRQVAIADFTFLVAVLLSAAFLALEYDVFKNEGTPPKEQTIELDELLCLGALLLVGLLTFAWRRMQESKRELRLRIAAEESARASARHDALTGLPNRRLFAERAGEALGQAWRNGSRCAVLFIDLDRFKPVNDTHGHAVGDALLVQIADRLRTCFPGPASVARLGGDEFAALVEYEAGDDVPALAARRVIREIERPFDLDESRIEVGATVGVAIGPESGKRAEDLIHAADLAMYEGKRERRGTVRFFKAA